MNAGKSRREFLKEAAFGAVGVAAFGGIAGCAPNKQADKSEAATAKERVTTELPIVNNYDFDTPEKTEHTCDVLVIGCGFAGLNAAWCAKQAGADVLVVDKGKPGFSGLSPWPGSHAFFDADMGDNAEQHLEMAKHCGEGCGNYVWAQAWIDESKDIYLRLKDFGIMGSYTRSGDDGNEFWQNHDYQGYREKYATEDRHYLWTKVLDDNGIPYIEHLMINNVIVEDGRAVGAVGFITTNGTIIKINAKSVIMAMGCGTIFPGGFPVGTNTFDCEYIAYNLGLPITGKESEDYHWSASYAPNSNFVEKGWVYLENIWPTGGGNGNTDGKAFAISELTNRIGSCQTGENGIAYLEANPERRSTEPAEWSTPGKAGSPLYGTNPDEMRSGKEESGSPFPMSKDTIGAPGMCCHCTSGVWCGYNDLDCATAIPGLYVAGDGSHALQWEGNAYGGYNGMTTSLVSIDGSHAGKAAAEYAAGVQAAAMSDESYNNAVAEIEDPYNIEKGFDVSWARDILQSIMAPYWVVWNKTEDMLNAALTQVEYMRDNVVPLLYARDVHELRLVHEMRHKVLASELKLRASLYRKESRGFYIRMDYPCRDDSFIGQVVLTKGDDGKVKVDFEPTPDEFKTIDTSLPYLERYPFYRYGELAALGLTDKKNVYTLDDLNKPEESTKKGA
ncbi:FAD-dependent oxidoreductase [Slackia isoflavoniconvertens]|uniref:FAD-dependent oxidoreductase n=1 Tax=Slackia isoflavoniconvertens TaxID=572010 RepID=UPI002E7881F3|nr:FAD-dependent oxidoreductase [Slackia isoflavoniconvertens]